MAGLYDAALGGDTVKVRALLAAHANLEVTNKDGRTPLMAAAMCEKTSEPLELLLEVGAQINKRDNKGWCAMHHAAAYGTTSNVNTLLAAGADINVRDNDGLEPLHNAAQMNDAEVVDLLLEWGANIDAESKLNETPLLCASGRKPENLKLLMNHGANVNKRNKWNSTPLHWACKLGCLESVLTLIDSGASLNVHNKFGDTPLHLACGTTKTTVILNLLKKGANVNATNKDMKTPLHTLCNTNNLEGVLTLLEHGADPTTMDDRGNTPLHAATWERNMGIVDALLPVSDVNMKNKHGQTPLMVAAEIGSAVVKILVKSEDLDAEAVDVDGNSAMHLACINGHGDVVQTLIRHGVKLDVCNTAGKQPLMIAMDARYGFIARCILNQMPFFCPEVIVALNQALENDETVRCLKMDILESMKSWYDDDIIDMLNRYKHVIFD